MTIAEIEVRRTADTASQIIVLTTTPYWRGGDATIAGKCSLMFVVSKKTYSAFHEQGLQSLLQRILERWHENLNKAASEVGEEGRNAVLSQIEALSREFPGKTEGELMMLADLKLVDIADQQRAAFKGDG